MSEREYQQRMLKSESKIVFCNWDRAKGKTYSIARHIEDKLPCYYDNSEESFNENVKNILIVVPFYNMTRCIISEIDEQIRSLWIMEKEHDYRYKIYSYSKKNNAKGSLSANINIVSANHLNSLTGDRKIYDYVYIDNLQLIDDNWFSVLSNLNYKQLFIMTTDNNIEYIEDDSKQLSENDWIEQEIKKLMKEFSEIPNSENTTKRREVVLNMIRELKLMKNINKDFVIKTPTGIKIGTCDDGFFKGGI